MGNIDNIMSPDVALFLKHCHLQEDTDQPETDGFESGELLDWLFSREDLLSQANKQLQGMMREFPEDAQICRDGHNSNNLGLNSLQATRPFYWAGSGDFVLTSRAFIFHVHGYPQVAQNWQTDDLIHCRLRSAGARQVVLHPP